MITVVIAQLNKDDKTEMAPDTQCLGQLLQIAGGWWEGAARCWIKQSEKCSSQVRFLSSLELASECLLPMAI